MPIDGHCPIRVFIGSGEASLIERKTLIHTLNKNSRHNLDVYVFNGTHNSIEHASDAPVLAPLSLELKYRNYTEFSLYRYLIPQICEYEGRAIFLDSDIICLTDINELFSLDMGGCDLLATPAYEEGSWTTSVLLIDCSTCRFDLDKVFLEVDAGLYNYADFSRLSAQYLEYNSLRIGKLDQNWNVFDGKPDSAKIVHFTNLYTQPWKFTGHPQEKFWLECCHEAIVAGFLTEEEIQKTILRGFARIDLIERLHAESPKRRSSLFRLIRKCLSLKE